jgi:hypothetical protein
MKKIPAPFGDSGKLNRKRLIEFLQFIIDQTKLSAYCKKMDISKNYVAAYGTGLTFLIENNTVAGFATFYSDEKLNGIVVDIENNHEAFMFYYKIKTNKNKIANFIDYYNSLELF